MKIFHVACGMIVALGLSALSASAAVFDADLSLTIRVEDSGGADISYEADHPFFTSSVFGNGGSFASANSNGTSRTVFIETGESVALGTNAVGAVTAGPQPGVATSVARRTGTLFIDNYSRTALTAVLHIIFDMEWFAAADPATESAKAEVFWELLRDGSQIFSMLRQADATAGIPGGSETNAGNSMALTVSVMPMDYVEYTIRAVSKGEATYIPAAVPLPAAGWLLIAGLGGLALVARRRVA